MAVIESPKSEGTFERRQVTRLPGLGIYGGFCSQYSLPKTYNTKYGEKKQFVLRFVVTHDQAYRKLPANSSAFIKVTNAINEKSNLVGALFALMGGTKSKEEIVNGKRAYDYDLFIGRPVSLLLQPYETPDKDGLYGNVIKNVAPPDQEMRRALKSLYEARIIQVHEKSGLKYLVSPAEEYEDENASGAPSTPFDDDEPFDESEIPF